MKDIKLDIKLQYTQQQLSTILDALNNAIISLQDVYSMAVLGFDSSLPKKLRAMFTSKSFEEIETTTSARMDAIGTLYKDLLSFEEKE